MKKDERGRMESSPLITNLCRDQVAGPGVTLHFNLQDFLISWAFLEACVWRCFAYFVDADWWRMGTRGFATPRQNCQLVMWDYERQRALDGVKVRFLWIVYIGSFVLCMIDGICWPKITS